MLERRFFRAGLPHFAFRQTGWYQTIRRETRLYKYFLLRNTLIGAVVVSAFLLAFAVFDLNHPGLVYYGLAFAAVLALFFILLRFRKTRLLGHLALVLPFGALVTSLFLPGSYNLHGLLLVVYPLLVIQLRGARRGSVWYGTFLGTFAVLYSLSLTGVIPPVTTTLGIPNILGQIATSLLAYAFVVYAESRQENLLCRLADRFVFDETTGLPGKDVLSHSIESDKSYVFAIIKIENYSDLVALFGYEFSDTIARFASGKLLGFEARFQYKTYQLKYNEYGILAEQSRPRDIVESAQFLSEVLDTLELEALPWEGDRINLVYRVGGALVFPGDELSPLTKADVALKKAERGHSTMSIFDGDDTEKRTAYDCVTKFGELVTNRQNESFLAVFQPIFCGDGLTIAWYEALLRVRKPDGTYESIFPYLAVARSTGFYKYLTEFIIRKSAEAIVEYDIDVSINIAIHDIGRPEFIQLVDEVYGKIRHKKGRIIFEILESDELVELDKCLWFIEYVSRYGFKFAIDDFGTGYSNYCSLINLPIDIVKIDGSLIKKIHRDENAKILVEGIVNFCERTKKKTVAEFVENEAVLDSLQDMKIDFLQGYYLAKPGRIPISVR